ncbi:hypothetical protein P3W53_29170 [Pseudomonas denitrificans (nom. rej.)]|nr:hypothetical protein [Pseudomonas denitrificans (nom. rej.)]
MILKILGSAFLILAFSSETYAEPGCRGDGPKEGIYQEVTGSFGLACIALEGGSVVLDFLPKGDGGGWIRNTALIDSEELNSGVVSLAVSSGVDLIFDYPRDVYIVVFSLDKKIILEAKHVLRVPPVNPEELVEEIVLRTRRDVLSQVSLGAASKDVLFGRGALELARPQDVVISSRKAILTKTAGGRPTGMYLIKGDKVKLIGYEDGWVRLEYLTAKGRRVSMWTELSNVL